MPARRLGASLVMPLLVVGWLAATSTASAAGSTDPRVTVISDSVLTQILWHGENLATLGQGGFQLDMQVAIGRRLAGVSVPFMGSPAPTVEDLIPTIPIYPTVIVEMGYNDDPAAFRSEAEQVIGQLLARGATHVIWPTLSESTPAFASMNRDLDSLLIEFPQLTLADWNAYSGPHPDWFQTDHLHLMPSGGAGMATLLNAALVSSPANGATLSLPRGEQGRRFDAQLTPPSAGPASWRIAAGSLPRGLALLASGAVHGVPKASGTFTADALAETATDLISHVRLTLNVLRAPTHRK